MSSNFAWLLLIIASGLGLLSARAFWALWKGIRDKDLYNIHGEQIEDNDTNPHWFQFKVATSLLVATGVVLVGAVVLIRTTTG